jgi:N-formylglutamate amidohydrolase
LQGLNVSGSAHLPRDRERNSILNELSPPCVVLTPVRQRTPFVISSPHSGRIYPKAFLESSRLDAHALRKSEDCYVDELFGVAGGLGAPMIAARFPRAYIDVNREPYELDPELFSERLPPFANSQSVRVGGGLGTIARIVADGEEIYREPLPLEAALERIERLYFPFHQELSRLIDSTVARFGIAILIDCHSMPSTSSAQMGAGRPHFILGDRFGSSCDGQITRFARDVLMGLGYDVHLNRPYAGGYITEHYGRPHRRVHAPQIEINRGLYLDEARLMKSSGFALLQTHLATLTRRMFTELPVLLGYRAAAE